MTLFMITYQINCMDVDRVPLEHCYVKFLICFFQQGKHVVALHLWIMQTLSVPTNTVPTLRMAPTRTSADVSTSVKMALLVIDLYLLLVSRMGYGQYKLEHAKVSY